MKRLRTAPPSAPVGAEGLASALQSMRDRMMAALTPKFGDAFDGDFDVMLEAINTMKRFRMATLTQQPAAGVSHADHVRGLADMLAPEKQADTLRDAIDKQPAAVDGAMVERMVEAFLASTGQVHAVTQLQRDLTTTCMKAALAAQPGGDE